jgi:5-methylcytosine-specific restriction endonuclease McrA
MVYVCEKCNVEFKKKCHYQTHLKSQRHLNGMKSQKQFTCDCGKVYRHSQSLWTHKKTCSFHNNILDGTITQPQPREKLLKLYIQKYTDLQTENTNLKEKIKQLEENTNLHKENLSLKEKIKRLEEKPPVKINICKRTKIPERIRQSIAGGQHDKCALCNNKLSCYFHIDHAVALRYGGNNEEDNLQALCAECHSMKSVRECKKQKELWEAIKPILLNYST